MVEVFLVVVLTVVGFMGLINLQVGTLRGVSEAKSMTQGVNLAEHFIETLKSEAISWNMDATLMLTQASKFPHLRMVGNPVVGGGSGWLRAYRSGSGSDKRVGPLGNDFLWDSGISSEIPSDTNAHFCVHYRVTWIIPNYLIRSDVRVLWTRPDGDRQLYADCPVGMETDLSNVASVSIPGTIMRNVFTQ